MSDTYADPTEPGAKAAGVAVVPEMRTTASVPAGFNERFIAYVIDTLPFVIGVYVSLPFALKNGYAVPGVRGELPWEMLWISAYLVYETVFSSGGRATLGKYIIGLRIRHRNGENLSAGRAFFRAAGYFASGACLNLGYLAALFTRDNRALHDYVAGSRVISVRERGEFAQGFILAVSWTLMAVFTGSWVNQNFLKMTPEEKRQVLLAGRSVSKIAALERIHKQAYGGYTDDIKKLASLTGNVAIVREELVRTLSPGTLSIASDGVNFVITARARNWRKTRVRASSLRR